MKKNNTSKAIIYQLLICACPNEEVAVNIAENIVAQKLAASVNILPAVYSVYQSEDNVESAKENMILIKTIKKNYPALEQVIATLHPYEVPEIIAIDINNGLPDYFKWMNSIPLS